MKMPYALNNTKQNYIYLGGIRHIDDAYMSIQVIPRTRALGIHTFEHIYIHVYEMR